MNIPRAIDYLEDVETDETFKKERTKREEKDLNEMILDYISH